MRLRWWRRQRFAPGGVIAAHRPDSDQIPVMLSPGREITDPDEAEALGLTADARRMRAAISPSRVPDEFRRAFE